MAEYTSSIILIKEIQTIEEKRLNQALKEQDITLSQAKTLSIILKHPEHQVTLKCLEKELGLAQSVTAGTIIRLEQKGYIESFGDSADKRVKIVSITPLGKQQFQVSQKILAGLENMILSNLSESEKQQLKALLTKVRNTLLETN